MQDRNAAPVHVHLRSIPLVGGTQVAQESAMNNSHATTVLDDLTARVQEQDERRETAHAHEPPIQPSNGAIALFLAQERLRTFDAQGCM
jgi:hypothetical protein